MPRASFSAGLEVFALRRTGTARMLRHVARALGGREPAPHGSVSSRSDLTELRLRSSRPVAIQVDGDYLGDRDTMLLRSVPSALRVVVAVPTA